MKAAGVSTPPDAYGAIAGRPALFIVDLARGEAFLGDGSGGTATSFEAARALAEDMARSHRRSIRAARSLGRPR